MITILHVIQDNKFNNVFKRFVGDGRLINKKALFLPRKNYKFNYIDNTEDISLLYGTKCIKRFLSEEHYDVIWFHSLDIEQYKAFRFIPKGKIIVWWAWGWDLYDSFWGLKPLLEVDLFKERTKRLVEQRVSGKSRIKDLIKKCILSHYINKLQKSIISRIDFFVPVLPIEYTMMTQNPYFHAEEFYYPGAGKKSILPEPIKRDPYGAILIGNSATYSMNHSDIIESLKLVRIEDRNIVVPLSYGDSDCVEDVKKVFSDCSFKTTIIEDFLPQKDYYDLMKICSYAIFGMMRQQAMANVFYCLKNGIKVFLYKNSIAYLYLKRIGAVVFAIEDITIEALQTPVSIEDTIWNRSVLDKMEKGRVQLYESGIAKIESELKQD